MLYSFISEKIFCINNIYFNAEREFYFTLIPLITIKYSDFWHQDYTLVDKKINLKDVAIDTFCNNEIFIERKGCKSLKLKLKSQDMKKSQGRPTMSPTMFQENNINKERVNSINLNGINML